MRRFVRRRFLLSGCACLFAAAAGFASAIAMPRYDRPPQDNDAPSVSARTSDVASAHSRSEPTPPLIEVLRAADELVQVGAIDAPPPEPEMIDVLRAADELIQAGAIERPPELVDVLHAATEFADAGLIQPPEPSLLEVLQSAQALADADAAPDRPAPRRRNDAAPAPPPAAAPTPMPTAVHVAPPPPPPPPPTEEPAPPPPAPDGLAVDAAFSARVFDAVNARRAEVGLPTVAVETRLARAAGDYASVLAANDWFSHTGPDGSTIVTRIEAAGFPFDVQVGEVIAWGTIGWTPAEIAQAWIDSPAHREQILNPAYTRAGMGCVFANGSVRCVMDLAG